MQAWINFWTIVFLLATAGFAVLVIVVAIRGFGDVLAMFRTIDAEHAAESDVGESGM